MTKIHDLIDDKMAYEKLKKDPTKATERKLLVLLKEFKGQAKITEDFYEDVKAPEGSTKPALLYRRVKIHKEGNPIRPVVATRGTATYSLAKRLAVILRP